MIKCPNCGAGLEYEVKDELVSCKYCKSQFNPKELEVEAKTAEEIKNNNSTFEGTSYLCSQCGAELMTFDETAITFCSYCGSQSMLKSRMITQNAPEFIIPLKKTQDECIKIYNKKISRALFAPSYMKKETIVKKFRGIYIPYVVYKLSFNDIFEADGEKYSHRSGDYVYYDEYTVSGHLDSYYEGISYDLISNYYDKFSQAIPHNFKENEKFNTNYLAGFYADAKDIDNNSYDDLSKLIVMIDSNSRIKSVKEYRKYNCKRMKIQYKIEDRKTGMFPVYFLAIRDKSNKHVNYAVVNGQTGKVAIDLPIDHIKYLIGSILLAIPIFLFMNVSFVVIPKYLVIISIITSIISLIIVLFESHGVYIRDNHLDDLGYIREKLSEEDNSRIRSDILNIDEIEKTLKRNKVKINSAKYLKYVIKPIIAIILGILVLALNFVYDIYYYGAAIGMFLLIVWSFIDIINCHNKLVSSKLPQLEKRGGDEDE